jgi:hypothetical protein
MPENLELAWHFIIAPKCTQEGDYSCLHDISTQEGWDLCFWGGFSLSPAACSSSMEGLWHPWCHWSSAAYTSYYMAFTLWNTVTQCVVQNHMQMPIFPHPPPIVVLYMLCKQICVKSHFYWHTTHPVDRDPYGRWVNSVCMQATRGTIIAFFNMSSLE